MEESAWGTSSTGWQLQDCQPLGRGLGPTHVTRLTSEAGRGGEAESDHRHVFKINLE